MKFIREGLIIVLLTLIGTSISLSTNQLISDQTTIPDNLQNTELLYSITASWDLTGTPIVIDNDGGTSGALTWVQALAQPWCSYSEGNYIIENVTIDGLNVASCITIIDSTVSFIIRDCFLTNSHIGASNGAAIKLTNTNNGLVVNNSLFSNQGYGILLLQSDDNQIIDNTISYNERGIDLEEGSDNAEIFNNSISHNKQSGIFIYESNNAIIAHNVVEHNGNGVYFNGDSVTPFKATIESNYLNNNSDSIYLDFYCQDSFITGNIINGSRSMGAIILSTYAKKCTISENLITNTKQYGIYLSSDSYNNTISKNTILNSDHNGIMIDGFCHDNVITSNLIEDDGSVSTRAGIEINSESDNNIVVRNLIRNCEHGLLTLSASDGNILYHNALINNGNNAGDYVGTNTWNVGGAIGNYYSDYAGTDSDHDGIGDSSYLIEGSVYDDYPLSINPAPGAPIFIDDSSSEAIDWNTASSLLWYLSGAGTEPNPYRLSNLTINADSTGSCITIQDSSKYFTIEGCTLTNSGSGLNDAGILFDTVDNAIILKNNISHNLNYGVNFVWESSNNSFLENTISFNAIYGVFLDEHSHDNTFFGNMIFNNTNYGIRMYTSYRTNLTNNIFYNNLGGINIHYSYGTTFQGNTLYHSTYGIVLRFGSDSVISHNFIYENDWGIYSQYSHRLNISQNIIEDSLYDGMLFLNTGENSTITGNIIANNSRNGISIQDEAIANNVFWNNSFYSNVESNAHDNGTLNHWYNGSVGNYWSDYASISPSAVDADDDGIGDIPYPIAGVAGSQDNYPIWEDHLTFEIFRPISGSIISNLPPSFQFSILRGISDEIWYSFDYGITNNSLLVNGSIATNDWSGQPDGELSIRIYMNDTHGYTDSRDLTIYKDTIAPQITITQPVLSSEYQDNPPIFGIIVDEVNPGEIWYTLDGGSTNISCTLSGAIDNTVWLSLPNGIVTLTFYSEDLAGNIGTAQVLIYKNGSEPVSSTTTTTTTTTTNPITTEPSSSIPSTSKTTSDPEVSSFPAIALLLMVVCMGIVKLKKRQDNR